MKARLYWLLALLLCTATVPAQSTFKSGEKYLIASNEWDGSRIVTGKAHGQATPVWCDIMAAARDKKPAADSWWIISRCADGSFTLQNAATGEYITYDGVRTATKRYIDLTKDPQGKASQWSITELDDGTVRLCSRQVPSSYFNVRFNSFILGTYATNSFTTRNGDFTVYDEQGRKVTGFDRKAAVRGLRLDGVRPAFDNSSQTYLFTIPEKLRGGKSFATKVEIGIDDEGTGICIDGTPAKNGKNFTFKNPGQGRVHTIDVKADGATVASLKLTFTYLPVLEIDVPRTRRNGHSAGKIRLLSADGSPAEDACAATLRQRGSYTLILNKKSYSLKLKAPDGKGLDKPLLGMRADNAWILDAMAVDHARMRNRVSFDLWNDFAARPYHAPQVPSARTGTRGHFVEVILGGHYQGIYCLTEKIDRKQLGLEKSRSNGSPCGLLYKSDNWSTATTMGYGSAVSSHARKPYGYSNGSGTWSNWETKYPKLGKKAQIDWAPLYDAVCLAVAGSDKDFAEKAGDSFDLPVCRDYWLLIELLLGTDNTGKNMYWFVHDKSRSRKISPVPWDMDGTWGREWNGHRGSAANPAQSYPAWLQSHNVENGLLKRLYNLDVGGWRESTARRYRELRKTHFQPERLFKRFADYRELFRDSGADLREEKRWAGANGIYLDFDYEMKYIEEWIQGRIKALDQKYGM